jgi:tRNA (mo5U34)-methyltransferase
MWREPRALSAYKRDPTEAAAFLREVDSSLDERRAMEGVSPSSRSASLENLVRSVWWYHTIELPGGIVTDGMFDHRPLLTRYGLPEDLSGLRCLDIACADGFWAFELERRGGNVTAVNVAGRADWDWPTGATVPEHDEPDAFAIAHRALESSVVRVIQSIYDLDPVKLGTFDFVHAGDVLLHLERPLEALRRFHGMVRERGTLLLADAVDADLCDPSITRYYGGSNLTWFLPGVDCLAQMVYDAGFSTVDVAALYNLAPRGLEQGFWRAVLTAEP